MIGFDVEVMEPEFPDVEFMIGNDDDEKPFLALRYKEGKFKGIVWSYTNIQIHQIDDYVDVNFGTIIYVNVDDVNVDKGSEFIETIGNLLDRMLEFHVNRL